LHALLWCQSAVRELPSGCDVNLPARVVHEWDTCP
jgi:hypothetical protein